MKYKRKASLKCHCKRRKDNQFSQKYLDWNVIFDIDANEVGCVAETSRQLTIRWLSATEIEIWTHDGINKLAVC